MFSICLLLKYHYGKHFVCRQILKRILDLKPLLIAKFISSGDIILLLVEETYNKSIAIIVSEPIQLNLIPINASWLK